MNLCSDGHDEVCYEVGKCPVCKLQETVAEQEEKISDLEQEIEELQNEEDE